MTRGLRHTLVGVLLLATIGCSESPVTTPTPTPAGSPQQARAYLEEILAIMQANSINRLTIDWNSFRATVLGQAASATTIVDTYPAITTALRLLGDGHSQYHAASGAVLFVPTHTCLLSTTAPPALPPAIGYVKVNSFNEQGAAATAFADSIQDAIRLADRDDQRGWIVDIRGNGGGNMWPMLAGVGPLLGESLVGYFIDPTGAETSWEYRDGASWIGSTVAQQVTAPYRLRRQTPRVAVLTDNAVASSGEAAVIAFRYRPDTRSFGAATCGLSTANESIALSDGARLVLTAAVMADRTHAPYGGPVVPDEITPSSQVVDRAVAWLMSGG